MSIDDMLDCPLRELNLLSHSPATNRYRFTLGPKPTLPSEVVAYAVLDYKETPMVIASGTAPRSSIEELRAAAWSEHLQIVRNEQPATSVMSY